MKVATIDSPLFRYPFGPARNPTSYDRSSVQLTSFYPGDPTTPGYPSYNKSKRAEPRNVPKIPSIPISWSNAQRLLQEIELGGQNRTVRVVNRGTSIACLITHIGLVISIDQL